MNTFFKLIFNPFEKVAGYKALVAGLLAACLSSVMAFAFNTRFDGILDVHFVPDTLLPVLLMEQLINISSLTIIFYGTGLILKGNHFRFADICGTLALARSPLMLAPFLNAGGLFLKLQPTKPGEHLMIGDIGPANLVFLIFASVILILLLIWYVTLLYKAYAISINVKGWKAIAGFVVSLLFAEILSKYLIFFFLV
jgi:hypothetical protein